MDPDLLPGLAPHVHRNGSDDCENRDNKDADDQDRDRGLSIALLCHDTSTSAGEQANQLGRVVEEEAEIVPAAGEGGVK